MEFDDLLITTGVDALVKLVKQKGRIELSECATSLNIQPDTLEEWARILEEEGIIKVEYKLTKVYLVWVQPTEEQIKEESETIEAERLKLLKELEKTKSEIPLELKKMDDLRDSFKEVYSKFSADIKKLEEKVSPFLSLKESIEKRRNENEDKFKNLQNNLTDIASNLETISKELREVESSVEKSKSEELFAKIKKKQDEIYQMMSELKELRRSIDVNKAVKAELPSAYELKKKFDAISKDFADLKNRNSALREDLISLKEGKEIVDNVGGALKDYEKTTAQLQKELSELTKEADALFERVKTIDEKVRESFDTINRFSDSLNVAKGIVSRFPNQEKLHVEQESILKKEIEIEQKIDALKKIVELAGGAQISAQEAHDLAEKIEAKLNELKEESIVLSQSLEEEKNRYFTFQQVRERVLPALRSYQNEIIKLKGELEKIKDSLDFESENFEKQINNIETKIGKEELAELFKITKEIEDKKKLLVQIENNFEELSERADNLNKRLSLLTNQAKILAVRAAPPQEEAKKEEKRVEETVDYFKRELQLTKEEEREFAKKREQLKKLIEKLWEEEKPKKK
ncbi:MAG: hypothetical protein QW153_02325 [Candidatus Bilamarchaeaceae archaeon]